MPINIDNLLPELVARVLFFLPPAYYLYGRHTDHLTPYACISPTWQVAVERVTFKRFKLKSSELEYFAELMRGAGRLSALRGIHYEVQLPTYSDETCGRVETEQEQLENDRAFTQGLRRLLVLLSNWEQEYREALQPISPIYVNLSATSPMDSNASEGYYVRRYQVIAGNRKDIFHKRYEKSYLRLRGDGDDDESGDKVAALLPEVSLISGMQIMGERFRRIHPTSSVQIASRFPNLENFSCGLCDNQKLDVDLRRRMRYEYALALPNLPKSIRTLNLTYTHTSPDDETFQPLSGLLPTAPEVDHFLLALKDITARLHHLRMQNTPISTALFSPIPAGGWPALKTVRIEYPPITPSGTWLFTGTPSEHPSEDEDSDDGEKLRVGDYPWRKFRSTPVADAMNDIYLAVGRAALCMSVLEVMELRADIVGGKARHAFAFRWPVGGRSLAREAGWVEWPEKTWEPSPEVLGVGGRWLARQAAWWWW